MYTNKTSEQSKLQLTGEESGYDYSRIGIVSKTRLLYLHCT